VTEGRRTRKGWRAMGRERGEGRRKGKWVGKRV